MSDNTIKNIKELVPYVVLIIIVILLKTFVFTIVRVNGESMMYTLHNKDMMILDKVSYRFSDIKRFDIVVVDITKPKKEKIIKRVIGLPGEEVSYKDNKLYINGVEIKDEYNRIEMDDFTYKLNMGEYYVMGDNRGNSLDSRIIGAINKKQILGKSELIIYPFNRLGIK